MDTLEKELHSRKTEIKKGLKLLLKVNVNITTWDVPEVDENESEKRLIELMQRALDEIKIENKLLSIEEI
jgi:hypothetical protein